MEKETIEEYAKRRAKGTGSDGWEQIMEGIIDGHEWAQEDAINFAEYIQEVRFNKYTQKSYDNKTVMWFSDKKSIGVTTRELFGQFLKNRYGRM